MKKTNQLILALLLLVAGAMNVSAGERVELSADMWHTYDGFGADATETGTFAAAYDLETASSCPIGDTGCNAWADLGGYSKMYVNMEGCDGSGTPNGSNPRIFINRLETEGQFNADKNVAKCLVIPNAGTWAEDYYTTEDDGTIVIDLVKIKKEFGFAHFHSIKGSAYNTQAIVHSLEVEKAGSGQQIGWTNLVNNSNMEGDDVSSFFVALDAVNNSGYEPATITDGVGVDGSRGIMVTSLDNATESWATQFFVRLNEALTEGTKWRVSFNYKADAEAAWGGGSHKEPREYIGGALFETTPDFAVDWQTYTAEGVVDAAHAGLLSIAFDLNASKTANNYYFDNFKFEIYKAGTSAQFSNDVILVDFGFDTNMADLIPAGAKRAMFKDCASVKVNGEEAEIFSIEGFDDGRFYIFLKEPADADAEVEVTFSNTIGLLYTSGANVGSAVPNFTGIAANNSEIEDNGGYPYIYETPTVMSTDPDEGSFNLPTSTTFTINFDKPADCGALVATANGNAMTVSPASGFASTVTLSGGLQDGTNVIKITKIYPEERLDDSIYGEFEFKVGVGKSVVDPADQAYDAIPAEYFANCAAGGIPEGFLVNFNGEERTSESTYGSGPRMFDFGAGGDFTKGLYFREGYAEFGSQSGYELPFKEGKKYTLTFNSAMWKDNGSTLDLKIFKADDTENAVFSQTVKNAPNVNGSTAAVSGTTKTSISFTPDADGNYIVRWQVGGFNEVLIANVVLKYMPDVPGLEYVMMLNSALDEAKSALEANSDERYQGQAFSDLQSKVAYYESYESTSPSAYKEAVADLESYTKALKDHRANCDAYDEQIKKAIDVARQNKDKKFAKTELYKELVSIVAKYNGKSEWRNVSEDPEAENWQLFYEYDVLTDDNQLTAATDELKGIANTTSLLFTEGFSAPENANGGKATGIAVLTERLRLGADAIVAAGESEKKVEGVRLALTDDDELAETVKEYLKAKVYNDLSSAAPTLFQEKTNEETLETTVDPVDMTVFVKNPNVYKLSDTPDFTDEAVPGWTTPEGYNRPGLTPGWGAWQGTSEIAQDAMFQTWGSSYRVQQTITDLPVGIYKVVFAVGERNNGDAGVFEDSYAYVLNSVEDMTQSDMGKQSDQGEDMYVPGIGQSFPFANNESQTAVIENIEVTDGVLTIGVNAGPSSHTFFNEVRVLMTAPVAGYKYTAMEYPELPKVGITGDVNVDGAVNVADISAIIDVMAGTSADFAAAADVNEDGAVNVADISAVIDIMAANARRLAALAAGE